MDNKSVTSFYVNDIQPRVHSALLKFSLLIVESIISFYRVSLNEEILLCAIIIYQLIYL